MRMRAVAKTTPGSPYETGELTFFTTQIFKSGVGLVYTEGRDEVIAAMGDIEYRYELQRWMEQPKIEGYDHIKAVFKFKAIHNVTGWKLPYKDLGGGIGEGELGWDDYPDYGSNGVRAKTGQKYENNLVINKYYYLIVNKYIASRHEAVAGTTTWTIIPAEKMSDKNLKKFNIDMGMSLKEYKKWKSS